MEWENQPFLEKEAAFIHPKLQQLFALNKLRRLVRPGQLEDLSQAIHNPERPQGKFVTNIPEQAGVQNSQGTKFFDTEEIAKRRRAEIDHEGTGSFLGDAILGGVGFVSPGAKERAKDLLFNMKQKLESADTKAGSVLAGNSPQTLRGKFFSVPLGNNGRGVQIGEKLNDNGSTSPIFEGSGTDRRPSLLAPVQNGLRVATPFLAASYMADKLYPQQQEQTAASVSDYMEKMSQPPAEPDEVAWRLDKQASIQKIAQLQDELEKVAAQLQNVTDENALLIKEASFEREEKQKVQRTLVETKQRMIEKTAEAEEFRLRTLARARSQSAVKLADEMLENGLIKQAQYDDTVDKLMDCDEESFNLYASMAKKSSTDEEGLESLAVLRDYSSNDMDSSLSRPARGLSKSGQTMGEAARELRERTFK